MIEYILESTFCLGILYLVFWLFFKNSRNFKANRAVLLGSVLFSLIVPLFDLSLSVLPSTEIVNEEVITQALTISNSLAESDFTVIPEQIQSSFLPAILKVIYAAVAIGLMLKCFFSIGSIILKGKKAETVNYDGNLIKLIDIKGMPFTFLGYIFVNREDWQDGKISLPLLLHEMAHKKQNHSIDVILIELCIALYWVNPFLYLFRKHIKANHEYLADDFVVSRSETSLKHYGQLLLTRTFPSHMSRMACGFNHILIKQRLIMLSKFQEKKPLAYRFTIFIPLLLVLFLATAFKSSDGFIPEANINYPKIEKSGYFIGDQLFWSAEDHKVYIIGESVNVKYGDNDFSGNGQFSVFGKVRCLVVNGELVAENTTIQLRGEKCMAKELSKADAMRKYGNQGREGALEIIVSE